MSKTKLEDVCKHDSHKMKTIYEWRTHKKFNICKECGMCEIATFSISTWTFQFVTYDTLIAVLEETKAKRCKQKEKNDAWKATIRNVESRRKALERLK